LKEHLRRREKGEMVSMRARKETLKELIKKNGTKEEFTTGSGKGSLCQGEGS